MPNGDPVITSQQGWKLVGGLVSTLIVIILGISGWAWSSTINDIEILAKGAKEHQEKEREEMRELQDAISKLQAHYQHIESNQQYFREKVDEILSTVRKN